MSAEFLRIARTQTPPHGAAIFTISIEEEKPHALSRWRLALGGVRVVISWDRKCPWKRRVLPPNPSGCPLLGGPECLALGPWPLAGSWDLLTWALPNTALESGRSGFQSGPSFLPCTGPSPVS